MNNLTNIDISYLELWKDYCILFDENNKLSDNNNKLSDENRILKEQKDKLEDLLIDCDIIYSSCDICNSYYSTKKHNDLYCFICLNCNRFICNKCMLTSECKTCEKYRDNNTCCNSFDKNYCCICYKPVFINEAKDILNNILITELTDLCISYIEM